MGKTNKYKQLGPFIYGDPRFLAGGSKRRKVTYNDCETNCNDGMVICPPDEPNSSLHDAMLVAGQYISGTKCGYHGCRDQNVFVSKDDLRFPTVGIELETILNEYNGAAAQAFARQIYTNWLHAENDGSLDRDHGGTYGYELVTAVLPARLYRDLEVWTGLQNLISPFVHSWTSRETGLHVHVGMDYFLNMKFPAVPVGFMRIFGKYLTTRLYYSLIPRSFAQRVFLRPGDMHFCCESGDPRIVRPLQAGSARQVVDETLLEILSWGKELEDVWASFGEYAISRKQNGCTNPVPWPTDCDYDFTDSIGSCVGLSFGHGSEINASPKMTLEFRRGKGTTNALSIHRMVELCCLTVMYAGHVIDNPDEEVSTKKIMSYFVENTTSRALKSLAEKEIARCS